DVAEQERRGAEAAEHGAAEVEVANVNRGGAGRDHLLEGDRLERQCRKRTRERVVPWSRTRRRGDRDRCDQDRWHVGVVRKVRQRGIPERRVLADDGAVSDGAVSDGAVSDGAVSDGAVSDGSSGEGVPPWATGGRQRPVGEAARGDGRETRGDRG